jgi:hypothetical protein
MKDIERDSQFNTDSGKVEKFWIEEVDTIFPNLELVFY